MALGRAARFGYDAQLLVKFLDLHSELINRQPDPAGPQQRASRPHRHINRVPLGDTNTARIIRRMRKQEAVTLDGADRILSSFDLSLREFEDWAESEGMEPVLRGR